MTKKSAPLKIGILLDDLSPPAWVAEVIRDIIRDPCVEIALLVVREPEEVRPRGFRSRLLGRLVRLMTGRMKFKYQFWQLYTRWDERRTRPNPDPFASVDLSEELKKFPRILVSPETDRFFHRFQEKDLESIRASRLDVMLRFGFNILKGPILESARYGVWSFHHGDNQHFRGSAPYFWELYEDVPITGIILQKLSEKLDSGRVLYRSYGRNLRGLSVKKNRVSQYWKGSSFVIRRLRQLHEHGWEWMEKNIQSLQEDPSIQGRLYRIPTNGQMVRFFAGGLWRNIQRRFATRGQMEYWFVSYRDRALGGRYLNLIAPPDHYYADPFPIRRSGRDYIFFEDFHYKEDRGVISFVEVLPDLSTTPARVVLAEPHHLSYPFLFEHEGGLYMIPESGARQTVELYKAVDFPLRWEPVQLLQDGLKAYDVTLLVKDGVYWFFAALVERGEATSDELFLFHSESLTGEWVPHPQNPIVSDVRRARPAGRFFERDGKLIRPSQDGSLSYGGAYYLNEVLVLTKTQYRERPIEHFTPSRCRRVVGTHTYNQSERIETIDVRALLPKSSILRK